MTLTELEAEPATNRTPKRVQSVASSAVGPLAALAAVCYLPLLLTARGFVAADTKAYLYLDPSRLLSRAAYLWDQNVAMGTVTHQNIGYLWPMGPWFWVFDKLGAPDWVAQRLWMGTLLFLAGAGVLYLGRTIGPRSRLAWTAAAFVYLLSPYALDYIARISVLLLPWAALPWMIALTHKALVSGRWREPALFALLVATAGGINATALVLAGLGPLAWLAFEVWVHHEVGWRSAVATVLRMGVLTLVTNLWWIAGLAVQSGWGLDVLRYTETVQTVARTSLSSEVLRGLGYWFFYGTDKLGPWIEPGKTFTGDPWLILVGFVLPIVAVMGAVLVRWRYRAFAVGLVLMGTLTAVGAFPYDHPSPIGAVFKHFATSSTAGLALRSTARAIPLLVLGVAMLLAALVAAVAHRRPRAGVALAVTIVLVALAGNPALWTGRFVAGNLRRPEDVPGYWTSATKWLDEQGDATRVLEIPGSDFATYRWGNSVDPITPGLMDRPYVARELIPFGTESSAALLIALDHRIQEGVLDPASLVPVARLMGVGDVVVRSDLEYERYRTARPSQLWALLSPIRSGLGTPVPFGPASENKASPSLPMHDEIYFALRSKNVEPPVAAIPVTDPLPIVRVRDVKAPVLLDGDGEGVVDAAAAGLLDGSSVLLTAASLSDRPAVLDRAIKDGGILVVTDTNRQRAQRWGTVRDNEGYTETPDERPLVVDPSDNRLPLFPTAPKSDYTTMDLVGVKRIEATAYGNAISYTPADRPANAFDGDSGTAWSVGTFGPVGGQKLLLETAKPVTTDHIDVVQADKGRRRITKLGVVLDGKHVTSANIDDSSLAGARISLGGTRTFSKLELVIEGDNVGKAKEYAQENGVGLSEVRVPGVPAVDQIVDMPSDLLTRSTDRPLTLVMSRLRASALEPFAQDEERTMVRSFTLPSARTFSLSGTARVDAQLPDDALDALLGGVVGHVATSSGRLPGDLDARASSTIDGDPSTTWTNHLGPQEGSWIEVTSSTPVTVDHLDLAAIDDGVHSVPTQVTITADGKDSRDVAPKATFAPLTGTRFRITIDAVRAVTSTDWFTKTPDVMPVAITDLGIPQVEGPRRVTTPNVCRSDLVSIDGRPVTVAVHDDRVSLCGDPVALSAGTHVLRTTLGSQTGLDIDRLVWSSGTETPTPGAPPEASTTATVSTISHGRVSYDLRVKGTPGSPTWLVLGQSWSKGWKATSGGHELGAPVLVDGYANGWKVTPGADGVVTVHLQWTPQKLVWAGIAASFLGVLGCLLILLGATLSRRRGPTPSARQRSVVVWRERALAAGPVPSWGRSVVVALGLGVSAGLVVHPLVGVGAFVVAIAALRLPYARAVGVAGAGAIALAGLFTAAKQVRNHFPADFGWTDHFTPAHYLAWIGLVLLGMLVILDRVRRRE